jgi:hypothetical protein
MSGNTARIASLADINTPRPLDVADAVRVTLPLDKLVERLGRAGD